MAEDIVKTGSRYVADTIAINRDLTEKALHMRCLAYYSNMKAMLLTETIFEVDSSKKALLKVSNEIEQKREAIARQKAELKEKNIELLAAKSDLERKVEERTKNLSRLNDELSVEVAERKQAEEKLEKTNRLYATLSQVNQAILRECDKNKLFQTICDIAIKFGKFRLAWIGLVDEKTQLVNPVAFSGKGSGYLQNIKISLTDDLTSRGPTGRSIREGKSVVFNDLETNPDYKPWRKLALINGYRSSAAFPIRLNDKVVGALNIYAVEPHFFDEAEIALLNEAARDISFALKTFEAEKDRRLVEEALHESEVKLNSITTTAFDAIVMIDSKAKVLFWNPAAERIFGYTEAEALGSSLLDLIIPEECLDKAKQGFRHFSENGEGPLVGKTVEMMAKRRDGTELPISHSINALRVGEGWGAVGIIQDITNRKKAEMEVQNEAKTTKNLLRLSDATSRISNIDELMESVTEISRDIIGVDLVMSYLWDSGTNAFRPAKAAGLTRTMLPLFKTTPINLKMRSIKGAMDTGRLLIESNMVGSEPLGGLFSWLKNTRTISILPLVGKKEYLGLIVCICFGDTIVESDPLGARDEELMQAISNQVSIALQGARHFKESLARSMELSRKVETIVTMSEISKSILSTLDLREVLKMTARMVSRLVPCEGVRIFEVDKDKEEFYLMVGFEDGRELERVTVPFSSTSLSEVVESNMPKYIADLRREDSLLEIEREFVMEGYLSALRTPIIVKGGMLGVLCLMSRRTAAFSPEDLSTLDKLTSQVGVALENARLVTDLEEFSIGAVRALSEAIDAKSSWTSGHSMKVTEIALRIGREMGFSKKELKDLRVAALLHDIGKIATNESILDKPGELNEEEFDEMKEHSMKGADILAPISQLSNIVPMIRSHHECFDGSGYPDGLKDVEIPLEARILNLADAVDAMGTDRPYRKGSSKEEIIEELKKWSGRQFDPKVVEAYIKTVEKD